ncbi:MAG: hypothetical protein UW76_C0030G0020 [Parcubacteria group bacterium GW2011_GWF2_44_8b]|nr:MAG: hypothetical protein UW76_C0030G0020 [Parcubacteria group bacterium GW2011_GWF2_44_8b]
MSIILCIILELVRTHFGEEVPPRKFGKAAEPRTGQFSRPSTKVGVEDPRFYYSASRRQNRDKFFFGGK